LDRQKIDGDILECGVFKGFSSWILLKTTTMQRSFYGVDTFAGLSAPSSFDGTHWKLGDLSSPISETRSNLFEFENRVHLYEGEIPEVFEQLKKLERKFAMIHIDVDLFIPTKFSLEFGWDNLVPGGMLFCDDYGFSSCPGATKAVDDFIDSAKGVELVKYPTGGIAIKKPRS
jgi:predicted O-methyltransferase YrrM